MIICKDVGFIHIPKTGGESIRHALFESGLPCYKYSRIHDPYEDVRAGVNKYNPHWNPTHSELTSVPLLSLTTFCVVRNPWARYVSWYLWQQRVTKSGKTFYDFMNTLQGIHPSRTPATGQKNPITQSAYLECPRTRVLEFEHLEEQWPSFSQAHLGVALPLPHRNKAQAEEYDYRTFYDDSLAETVGVLELSLCSKFSYRFDHENYVCR